MENQNTSFNFEEFSNFDIKALLLKIISYWKWFLLSLIIAFFATRYYNNYQERVYSMTSLITVKDENNPIFSSSTNIAFNWGGPSDKVETIKTILTSRTHNEKVVQEMQYYIDYLVQGKYRMEDVYGKVPFKVVVDTTAYELMGTLIQLQFPGDDKVKIHIDFGENPTRTLIRYADADTQTYTATQEVYENVFPAGLIKTDFMKIHINLLREASPDQIYYIRFNNFNSTVSHYRGIVAKTAKKGTSLISLSLDGTNKKRLVDYINTTVEVLKKDQIAAKIKYAVKTKNYIDTLFKDIANNLQGIEKDLGSFKQKQNIYDLSKEGTLIFNEVVQLDATNQKLNDRLEYFNSLKQYLKTHTRYDANSIPVPAVITIEDSKISSSIGTLISKSKARETLLQTVTPDYPPLKQLNAEIELERNTLLENINGLIIETEKQLARNKKRLNNNRYKLTKLPRKEQTLLSFERKYAITERNYNYLKQKSYEAGTAIASNVSDIKIIDTAKDIGQTYHKPNKRMNNLIGFAIALFIPLLFILFNEFFNNKVQTVEEIENTYKIPILGVVGSKETESNLVVLENPKSSLSESYRALRSNVQFMLKRDARSHVILITSSISGEGKTITAINLSSVFALSGKKTILVGVDLRKPKIAEDFGLDDKLGLVHYLIGQKEPQDIIQTTQYENLDILLSGPVPPNPSELLLSENMERMINYLKEHYDYIILDAPPIGAVSDAQELFKYSDTILYVIRQNYTDKGLMKMIENKYKRNEVKNISYVLNDFNFTKRHGYGYGYSGYGYDSYGYYQKRKPTLWQKILKRRS